MAEQTFKVGDKVRHPHHGTVEVTYGPYKTALGETKYMMRFSGEAEQAVSPSMLTPLPAFAVGDKVRKNGHTAEILAGPVQGAVTGEDVYLYRYADGPNAGKGGGQRASKFEALPTPTLVPVGTRVRVDRAKWAEERHGTLGRVTSNSETWHPNGDVLHRYAVALDSGGRIDAAEVTPIADEFTHEGVTYDLTARYRDKDGDVWNLADVGGVVYARTHGDGGRPTADSLTLEYVARRWGPLTKHTA